MFNLLRFLVFSSGEARFAAPYCALRRWTHIPLTRQRGLDQVVVKPMVGLLFEERPQERPSPLGAGVGIGGGVVGGYSTLFKAHHEMCERVNLGGAADRSAVMEGLERYCNAAAALGGERGNGATSVLRCVQALQQSDPKALLTSFSTWLQV